MAPEHVEGAGLDFRTDVFAVGILTYQLATGQLPFRGKNPHEVLKKIAECKYAPPEAVNPLVGARLGRILKKALARDPADRYPDVALLRKELLEDLADAGVEDVRPELARFWKDPKGWARAFGPRLVAQLGARGRELRQKGRTAAALELWSRALAVDPRSPELKALVEGVARLKRLSSGARVALVLALLGGGTALGVKAWRKHQPPPPPPAAAPPKLQSLPEPHTDFKLTAEKARPEPARADKPRPVRPAPAVKKGSEPAPVVAMEEKRFVELVPTPKAVRVSLDGKPLGDFGPELARLELGPGAHTFVFESPFCYPKTVTVGEKESPGRLVARLKWKPATLIVEAHPAEADVLIDGRLVVRSGQPVPLPIDETSLDGRREVAVKVSAPGHQTAELTLKLRANEALRHPIELKPRGHE
jgi:serine/threonine-protein kinase